MGRKDVKRSCAPANQKTVVRFVTGFLPAKVLRWGWTFSVQRVESPRSVHASEPITLGTRNKRGERLRLRYGAENDG